MVENNFMNSLSKTRIFLVEDNQLFLQGLKHFISQYDEFEVVGSAIDGPTAFKEIQRLQPDIAIIDVILPGMDGLTLIEKLKKYQVPTRTLVLSESQQEDLVDRMVRVGVDSYVTKADSNQEIYKSLVCLAEQGRYFSPKAGEKLFQNLRAQQQVVTDSPPTLTPRELQVAELLEKKMTNKEIAQEIGCSAFTVKCHKANLMRKLNVSRSADVVAWLKSNKKNNTTVF